MVDTPLPRLVVGATAVEAVCDVSDPWWWSIGSVLPVTMVRCCACVGCEVASVC